MPPDHSSTKPDAAPPIGIGVNPSRQRDHNERLVLSVIKAEEGVASSQIARQTGLSAQSASVLTRKLETEGLITRGDPIKGKVGKPRHPLQLDPDGVFSYGLRIGRRGADLILVNFKGELKAKAEIHYAYPTPALIESFAQTELVALEQEISPQLRGRIAGIGIAAPFELWNWLDLVKAPKADMALWKDHSFSDSFATFTDLPIHLANDGTMACSAELSFGHGTDLHDFIYFFVGSFVAGGLVLNNAVVLGSHQNAAAYGSIPVGDVTDSEHQLIHHASLYVLENQIQSLTGQDKKSLRLTDAAWQEHSALVEAWCARTAKALAKAIVSIVAVVDVQNVVLDGGMPAHIRADLVERVQTALSDVDTRGILPPRIIASTLGREGAALGAAYLPIEARYLI